MYQQQLTLVFKKVGKRDRIADTNSHQIEKSNEKKKEKGKRCQVVDGSGCFYRREQPSSHTIYLHSSCRSTETHTRIYTERKRRRRWCMGERVQNKPKILTLSGDKIKYAKMSEIKLEILNTCVWDFV